MKIATLQFAPRLGEVGANFSRAESLLMRQEREGELEGIDLLVLPELAFTGEFEISYYPILRSIPRTGGFWLSSTSVATRSNMVVSCTA